MRSGLLNGSFDLSIDERGRVPVPSEIRKVISPAPEEHAFFVRVGSNGKIWAYAVEVWKSLVGNVVPTLTPTDEELDFYHSVFSATERIDWDDQGRILLPKTMLERTGTGRKVTMIGAVDHLEIYNREDWSSRLADLDRRRNEVMASARKAQQIVQENKAIAQ